MELNGGGEKTIHMVASTYALWEQTEADYRSEMKLDSGQPIFTRAYPHTRSAFYQNMLQDGPNVSLPAYNRSFHQVSSEEVPHG